MSVYFSSGTYVYGTQETTSITVNRTTSGTLLADPPGTAGYAGIVGHTASPIGAFSVSLDAGQDTYTGTGEIKFTSTEFNYGNWYSTLTGRFTPQVAGIYWIATVMMFDNDAAHLNSYYIVAKNGSTGSSLAYNNYYAYTSSMVNNAGNATHKNNFGQSIFYLNGSSDYVSVHVGTANALYMNSILYTRFMGCFVAAT